MATLRFVWNSSLFIKRLLSALVICTLSILIADIIFNHYKVTDIGAIRRFFNITREDGIANFYSSLLLVANGVTLLLLYWFNKVAQVPKAVSSGWLLLALFFMFMGFDDATKFHERVGTAAKTIFSSDSQEGAASTDSAAPERTEDQSVFDKFEGYPWQIVFGPFFAAMGCFILFFLWRQLAHKQSRFPFVSALAFYVVAVGFDYIEGFGTEPYEGLAAYLNLQASQVVHLAKAVEETFENFGHTFFLVCFLSHLFDRLKAAKVIELRPE